MDPENVTPEEGSQSQQDAYRTSCVCGMLNTGTLCGQNTNQWRAGAGGRDHSPGENGAPLGGDDNVLKSGHGGQTNSRRIVP